MANGKTIIKNKLEYIKIGKTPMVVLSLEEYERMKEEMEMLSSKTFTDKIAKARKEKKLYSADQVKKMLGFQQNK